MAKNQDLWALAEVGLTGDTDRLKRKVTISKTGGKMIAITDMAFEFFKIRGEIRKIQDILLEEICPKCALKKKHHTPYDPCYSCKIARADKMGDDLVQYINTLIEKVGDKT